MHLPAVVHVSTGFLLCSLSLFSDVSHGSGDFALSGVRFVSNTRLSCAVADSLGC